MLNNSDLIKFKTGDSLSQDRYQAYGTPTLFDSSKRRELFQHLGYVYENEN